MTPSPDFEFRFKCSCCGNWHEGLPDLAFAAPYYYEQLSDTEKATRATKSDDLCTIDDSDFFIRAVLPIPAIGANISFGMGSMGVVERAEL